jgi:flagellar biosynthesis protein FlhG
MILPAPAAHSGHVHTSWANARVDNRPSADQAEGLRRLFDGRSTRALAVVSNPAVAWSGLLIESLSESMAAAGLHTLVVDASETAPVASEWAHLDLRWAIEPRADQSSYLGARGLLRHHVDAQGRAHGFLRRAAEAAPWADVLLVHAPALDLMRLFAGHDWRPILLADATPVGAMQAYGSLKSMARSGLSTFDILLESSSRPVLGPRVALRLADSASRFLSWPVSHSVVLQGPAHQDPAESSRLQDLIRAQWAQAVTCAVHRTPAFNHERLA